MSSNFALSGGRGTPPPEVSSKNTCLQILKGLSLPVVLIAGPIIALVGFVISLGSNLVGLGKAHSLHDKVVKTRKEALRDFPVDPADLERINLEDLQWGVHEAKTKLRSDCIKWGKRLIPFFYGVEMINSLMCQASVFPKGGTPQPSVSRAGSRKMSLPSDTFPGVDRSSQATTASGNVNMVTEVGGFRVPAPAQQRMPFDFRSLSAKTPAKKACDNAQSGVSMDVRCLQELLAVDWLIKDDGGPQNAITMVNKRNGILMTMVQHNIADPYDTSAIDGGGPMAIVNAANHTMTRGMGGTNRALTNVTTPKCWQAASEGKVQLNPGEATGGFWESTPQGPQGDSTPRAFIQALGPNLANYSGTAELFSAEREVLSAFSQALLKAEDLGCSIVQLPMLSDQNFAPKQEPAKSDWMAKNKSALLRAIGTLDDDGIIKHVVLVNYGSPPSLANYARDYSASM